MQRENFPIWTRIEVRWGDMDALNHVNNATYFTYLESARIQLFAGLGLADPMTEEKLGMNLAHAACNFRSQVRYPEVLEIGTVVTKIGTSSFHLAHVFLREGTTAVVADGSSVVVWTDYTKGKSAPLPGPVRIRLQAYMLTQV
jgi:acyl-CoA thioester hydrolase